MGFKREPALLALPVLTTILAFIAHALGWSAATTSVVGAVVVAAGAVITAALARPYHPTVVAGAVGALVTLVSHYWLHAPASMVSVVAMGITLLIGLVVRHQITPITA